MSGETVEGGWRIVTPEGSSLDLWEVLEEADVEESKIKRALKKIAGQRS
jgi:hypothetical protein